MTASPELVRPYGGDESKGRQLLRMFDSIAGSYDRLNRVLSFGLDRQWRRKAVGAIRNSPTDILDLAAGTGDLSILMARRLQPYRIIAVDISEKMMAIGKRKVAEAGLSDLIRFECRDCLSLSFGDNTFDAVTIAFGLRNLEDLGKGLAEMLRVLKPGGQLLILELSRPQGFPMRQLYRLYSTIVIPPAGMLLSGQISAYRYLPASIRAVPQGRDMERLLEEAGFTATGSQTFSCGICSMYTGFKTKG
ncbi:MAG: bifunctional demethylmenaquinone methyltransferase/2-methoxy-6-polyprenyl-1,4-benzoquinol methylase UbiE [Tannerellaceae bacterium]|nr:bifunctional demethylmenaquinone methyltransferase/2-methoxy-6-polyprenyl-1,4-benzoquinol methylase UbiE [Tannerellaceae bacterium]